MYKEGNILYFTPFYFRNGNTAKPKYFLVLKEVDNNLILASLPTRKDSIPEKDVLEFGCVEIHEINLNCFVISPDFAVTKSNKCFDFRTHIYGYQLDTYSINDLRDFYKVEGVDFELFGVMKDEIFAELISCLKNSKAVKRKYVRLL